MDSAIIDPLDEKIVAAIVIGDMFLGHDAFCNNFLKGARTKTILS